MNKEFAPYQPSLDMKGLGFDEPCFAYYDNALQIRLCSFEKMSNKGFVSAPTFSQSFRWFREKHNLVFNFINYSIVKPGEYHWSITWNDEAKASGIVKTYEEAELECLKKLIEIVKKK
jgi:hypothetical protein